MKSLNLYKYEKKFHPFLSHQNHRSSNYFYRYTDILKTNLNQLVLCNYILEFRQPLVCPNYSRRGHCSSELCSNQLKSPDVLTFLNNINHIAYSISNPNMLGTTRCMCY